MYWSRKFRLYNCTTTPCDYIGIAKNDKRHAIRYPDISGCSYDKLRKHPRVQNNKEEMKSLIGRGRFNDVYKSRVSVDKAAGIRCGRSLTYSYRRNQPAKNGQLGNDDDYNYSYNEFLRNKKMTYKYRLPTSTATDSTYKVGGYGGSKCEIAECTTKNNTVIWKPNNEKYNVQGAVSSSSRIDRLKLETIRGSKKCENNNAKCGVLYFAGKPRNEVIYNKSHKELCGNQNKARGRARGRSSQMSTTCY
tara:strand:- start:4600 stop:5343 length:744 start_codon:yes stop_codon:yes gene_type:complete